MKKALNAWTVEGSLSFEEMFAAVSAAGFDGIELNVDRPGSSHGLSMETTEADYAAIRALSAKYNLPVISISTSLCGGESGIPEKWDYARALLRKQIEAAKALGAKGVLTVPGGKTLKSGRENSIAFFQSMREEIEREEIFVGVENVWNGFFLSPFDMQSLIDAVGSPMIGAYLDLGNMLAFSVPEQWVEVLEKRIGFVHLKDYKRNGSMASGGSWEDITHGSANWPAIIAALRAIGFDGYLTAEVGKADDAMSFDEYYRKVAGEIASIL